MSRRSNSETEIPFPFLPSETKTPILSEAEGSQSKSTRSRRSSSETEASLLKDVSRRSPTPIIFSQSTARRKPPAVEKKLNCTLEELSEGCVKKIMITRDVITNTGFVNLPSLFYFIIFIKKELKK
jgi:DnaJ family protein B protein 13